MAITTKSISHVRLTVTDIDRSRQFYESVFGWPVALEVPEDADEETREQLWFLFGGVIYHTGTRWSACGRSPPTASTRTGSAWTTSRSRSPSKDEMDAAAAHLDGLGIAHEPVKDIGTMYILEFRDPDNIALELIAPK